MRVACVDKDGFVINVIEVNSMDEIPDVVYADEQGNVVYKKDVLLIETNIGSVGDLYIEGKGFYRLEGK